MDDLNPKPICKIDRKSNTFWYLNGRRHRTAGPAVVWANGTQWWFINDRRHRTDGPAVVWADGSQEWWLRDQDNTSQVKSWMKTQEVTWPWDRNTKVEFALVWSRMSLTYDAVMLTWLKQRRSANEHLHRDGGSLCG